MLLILNPSTASLTHDRGSIEIQFDRDPLKNSTDPQSIDEIANIRAGLRGSQTRKSLAREKDAVRQKGGRVGRDLSRIRGGNLIRTGKTTCTKQQPIIEQTTETSIKPSVNANRLVGSNWCSRNAPFRLMDLTRTAYSLVASGHKTGTGVDGLRHTFYPQGGQCRLDIIYSSPSVQTYGQRPLGSN